MKGVGVEVAEEVEVVVEEMAKADMMMLVPKPEKSDDREFPEPLIRERIRSRLRWFRTRAASVCGGREAQSRTFSEAGVCLE